MNTQELEQILEGGTETQRIEFKGACDWSVRLLAKDILALSNVRDGGYIVVGVEDETFNRQGT
jgi:predicted HTH transcriptional regulator